MRLVIIESPYRAATVSDAERNKLYLQDCIRDCLRRGESPYASHQMLTDALDDQDDAERRIGIAAGLEWWRAASAAVFYTDLGWSEGMLKAWALARVRHLPREERKLCAS